MVNVIAKVVSLVSSEFLKRILFSVLRELVKRTPKKWDDLFVEALAEALQIHPDHVLLRISKSANAPAGGR